MVCLWQRCTLRGLLYLERERLLAWGSTWGERLYGEACATLAAEHVLRRIHEPADGTGPGELGPATTAEVHPCGVGKATVYTRHRHHLYAITETYSGRHTRSSRARRLRCSRMYQRTTGCSSFPSPIQGHAVFRTRTCPSFPSPLTGEGKGGGEGGRKGSKAQGGEEKSRAAWPCLLSFTLAVTIDSAAYQAYCTPIPVASPAPHLWSGEDP
jgi:hypothetical protein